jgi:hypothetical protein
MVDTLKSVVRSAFADGYVNTMEAALIEKYALKDDNTVTKDEKAFLQDAYEWGAYLEPYAHYVFDKLTTYGDVKIDEQMDDLRQRKISEHWFNDEYISHATPVLINSTDLLSKRMDQALAMKREANMFTSEFKEIGEKILLNSEDPVVARMACLKDFKSNASMFTSDYTELGKKLLLNSYDTKAARLMALDQFRSEVHLWDSEYREIKDQIINDT